MQYIQKERPMNETLLTRAGEIVAQNTGMGTHCALALIDLDGSPTVSTITASQGEGIQWLTFCTGFGTRTQRIAHSNRASVCFNSPQYNITLVGSIEVITDPATKQQMWYSGLANHFSGPEDPGYCVLRFTTERYSLLVDWQEARGRL